MPNFWDGFSNGTGGFQGNTLKFKPDGTPDYQSDGIAGWTRNRQDGDVNWADNPYQQLGWFPIWKDSLKGQEMANNQLSNDASKREADLTNPNSKYYTDYLTKLKGTLSAQSSLNSLLGLNRAMGLSQAGSATIANEQRNALQGKITDAAIQGTQQLWQANTGQANSLLGMQFQNNQAMLDYQLKQKMYEDSKKFDFSQLIQPLATLAGTFLAPGVGTAAGSALGGMAKNYAAQGNFNNTANYYQNKPWTLAGSRGYSNPYGG